MAPRSSENGNVDQGAVLIARNRPLLMQAEEARAWSYEAQEQAKNTMRSLMEDRLAWALARQRRNHPRSKPPDLP